MNSDDVLRKVEELRDGDSDIEFTIDSEISLEDLGRAILNIIGDGRQSLEIYSDIGFHCGNLEYGIKVSVIRQDYINFCECCQKNQWNIKMSPFGETCENCETVFKDLS